MIFLKNFTSEVPVATTIHRIEQVLIKCGVSGIGKDYSPTGEVVAVTFRIELPNQGPITIRLPADKERALDALWANYVGADQVTQNGTAVDNNYKKKRRSDFRRQAERTAWRIIQDWVEVQMSMIQLQQADVAEVFMPYVWDGKRTLYQAVKDGGYKGLLPERAEH